MSLDSIYAMLSKPVQFISQRRRIVDRVSASTPSSEIAADNHEEEPQTELPSSNTQQALHTQAKPKSKLEYELGTGDYITDDDAPISDSRSADKIKHIDLEV